MEEQEKKGGLKHLFDFGPVFGYFFRKKKKGEKIDVNLKMMHGSNKISIIVFLIAFVIWLVRRLT